MNFLKPNDNVSITSYEGEILGIQLPDKVALQVVEAEQAVRVTLLQVHQRMPYWKQAGRSRYLCSLNRMKWYLYQQ